MWTLALLLTRMFAARFALILFGVCAFFLTLDIVTYADDILALHKNDLSAIGRYALLRLPGTIANFLGIAVLLAMLLTLLELSLHSELVAMWAAGCSHWRLVLLLAPLGLLLGVGNFLVHDRAVPSAAPVLHEWGIGDYGQKKLKVDERDPIWMRSGNDILRARSSNPQATELEDLIIFRRDAQGLLTEQIMAAKAVQLDARWELSNVAIYYRENLPPSRVDRLIYSGLLRPAAVGARSGDPEEMSLTDLDYFIENSGFGIRPVYVYTTRWHKRISLFLAALLMIAICVPLAVRFQRGGGLGILFAAGVAMGFGFFIFDGISLTLGELGLVPPWMAAWAPTAIFGAAAALMAVRFETV